MSRRETFLQQGFLRFAADDSSLDWARHALPFAAAAARDPAQAHWLRCGGTWFVGVDALPNDGAGRVPGGPPLAGAAAARTTRCIPAPTVSSGRPTGPAAWRAG